MSIYAQLLDDALAQTQSHETSTTGDAALAQLLELRRRLGGYLPGDREVDWAPAAIAEQLAYDVALIELSRYLGIEASVTGFDQPKHERTRLERALAARGLRLDELDAPSPTSERSPRLYGQR